MGSTITFVLVAFAAATCGAGLAWLWSRARQGRTLRAAMHGETTGGPIQGAAPGGPVLTPAELDRREAEIEHRNRTVESAERFRNRLLSKLSHDVRTPLNSIITLSQLLQDGSTGPLGPDQRKYAEVIHHSGQTLLALINDVLDLSHIEAGRLDLDLVAVDVRALLRSVGAASEAAARAKGLPLHVNPPRVPLRVRADEDRLRQVLVKLVEHAIDGTANGYVEVSAEADEQQVTIRISDTSAGATPGLHRAGVDSLANQSAIAPEPGLILADRLVKLMDGSISIDSAAGDGTTFTITLPRAPASTQPSDDAQPVADGADGAAPMRAAPETLVRPRPSTPEHVLLIEDDEIERDRIATLLVGAGYRVSPASSGQEGLNQLREGRFDGVVLDLVMPGMSGLDVLRAARSDERLSAIPFVVLSALYMTRSEREVLGPTVAAVVRKGEGTSDELLMHLERALASKSAAGGGLAALPELPHERLARVLLVEDDEDNLFAIEQVLASLPIRIQTAATAEEAIEICRRQPPDLILMDMELSGNSGVDASADIRRLPDCAGIPIIALTAGMATAGEGRRTPTIPCSGYLSKPVKPGEVVSAVTRALQLGIH